MHEIGRWVIETACSEMRSYVSQARGDFLLNVNVSANQFSDPAFLKDVARVLHQTGFPADRFRLEMTESAVMNDPDRARSTMSELRGMGVSISIDDFGTGHSSLAYLSRFPIDEIKIDRTFVAKFQSSPEDRAITRSIIALGKALGVAIVAEGVEEEAQRDRLAEDGCDIVQGFLYSPPIPIDRFRAAYGW